MKPSIVATLLALPLLAACGGGGGGGHIHTHPYTEHAYEQQEPSVPPLIKQGQTLVRAQAPELGHYFSPSSDLPRNIPGVSVSGPDTGIEIRGAEDHPVARATAKQAFLQWTRHLESDPGYVTLSVENSSEPCHGDPRGCYITERPHGFVFYDERMHMQGSGGVPGKRCIGTGDPCNRTPHNPAGDLLEHHHPDPNKTKLVIDTGYNGWGHHELLGLLAHEAGHRFDYVHASGSDDGCAGVPQCHAPHGSGSVMSYDHDARMSPNEEDIESMGWPEAVRPTWNPSTTDSYTVTRDGATGSGIGAWGIWINHESRISNDSIHDQIQAGGFIENPSTSPLPSGAATYTGRFLGLDMSTTNLGEVLKAEATFYWPANELTLTNFSAYRNGGWTSGRIGTHTVQPDSVASYSNGWIAGTVANQEAEYTGSFTAQR